MYAYLNIGLSLYFNGQRYYSANGLQDLLESETGEERLYTIIAYRSKTIEFALTHSDNYGETSFSFVNGQYTNDGGTHLSPFKEGVRKGINEFSGKNYKAAEIRDGMIGAIAIKVSSCASRKNAVRRSSAQTDSPHAPAVSSTSENGRSCA